MDAAYDSDKLKQIKRSRDEDDGGGRKKPKVTDWVAKLGGKPTRCTTVDLEKLRFTPLEKSTGGIWGEIGVSLLYDGQRPVSAPTKIAKGGAGSVYNVRFGENVFVALKRQDYTAEADWGLEAARKLKECDLVQFVSHVESSLLYTAMERLTSCEAMPLTQRRKYLGPFIDFLTRTLECIEGNNSIFWDMKLANCAYKVCGESVEFRLIDLDGINNQQFTYVLAGNVNFLHLKNEQTRYAFAITLVAWFFDENKKKDPDAPRDVFKHPFARAADKMDKLKEALAEIGKVDEEAATFIRENGLKMLSGAAVHQAGSASNPIVLDSSPDSD